MSIQYTYPTPEELSAIEPELRAEATFDDPIFEIFPIRDVDSHVIQWEQKDEYDGLQKVRGLNGQPGQVARLGANKYTMAPGVYGEQIPVDEEELTTRRAYGMASGFMSIEDIVLEINKQMVHREINRIRYIAWTLISTGTFSVSADHGGVLHTDRFDLQTYTRAVDWDTAASMTPIADFMGVQALAAGHGVNLGAVATAFMNRTTANKLFSCTNTSDIAGKRLAGGSTVMGVDDVNKVLLGMDLPTVRVYDEGYYNAGTFTRFLGTDIVVIVGKRQAGDSIAEYRMTRNLNRPDGGPGSYAQVVDSLQTGTPVPRTIHVHRGHNGGPVIYRPASIVVMDVS